MLQDKEKLFLKQLQPKSQNRHFHTPAANSLLLQKQAWHITSHLVVEVDICFKRITYEGCDLDMLEMA